LEVLNARFDARRQGTGIRGGIVDAALHRCFVRLQVFPEQKFRADDRAWPAQPNAASSPARTQNF